MFKWDSPKDWAEPEKDKDEWIDALYYKGHCVSNAWAESDFLRYLDSIEFADA